jgi:uncharacterized membrane protein YcaP (DUF421 family)
MLPPVQSLLPVSVHTLVLYLLLIVGLRVVGRRQMGQLNVVDLTIIILLGSAVETAMIAGNTSLLAGLVSAATLLLANRLLAMLLQRSHRLRHLVVGHPVVLVHRGHFVQEHLRRTGLLEADVEEAIRERGFADVKGVEFAVLETDGSINVVPAEAPTYRGKKDIRSTSPPPPALKG